MNGNSVPSRDYILVTPCKNEAANLPKVIDGVATQTILPSLWLIIDDGSTDDTQGVIQRASTQYKWIEVLRLDEAPRDLGLHLAKVLREGFDLAISISNEREITYSYLGNLDADIVLPPTFYENLMREMENDPKIGLASGGTENLINGVRIKAKFRPTEPSGGHMLIRRSCFEDCNGIIVSYSVDSVLKAKARVRGWKTRRFDEYLTTELRDVSSAQGYWKGIVKMGESFYFLNFHPINALGRSLRYIMKKPYYGPVPFMLGYLNGVLRNKQQIEDEELRSYFWNKWKEYFGKDKVVM